MLDLTLRSSKSSRWRKMLSELRPPRRAGWSFAALCCALIVFAITRRVSSPALLLSNDAMSHRGLAADDPKIDRPGRYIWLSGKERENYEPLIERITAPHGFERIEAPAGSFGDWLRHLPLAALGTPVTTARGRVVLAAEHPNVAAVVALQPHTERLLTASNMLIRLRAEYCWATRRAERLAFHYTSGHRSSWRAWSRGVRPRVDGRDVTFRKVSPEDRSRASFCGYLETLFQYASSYSLLDDTRRVDDHAIAAGDVLLLPGRPGHAIMILDIATNPRGALRVLLGQGGSPARTFHVLRSDGGSPWFALTQTGAIDLGKRGVFRMKHLRHWAE